MTGKHYANLVNPLCHAYHDFRISLQNFGLSGIGSKFGHFGLGDGKS
jgi:hypothetical protein